MSYFFYSLLGLTIASEIEFLNLVAASATPTPDYTILLGKTPYSIEAKQCGVSAYANQYEFLFSVKNIASFYVTEKQIIIDQCANTDSQDIKTFLLHTAFAYILNQKQYLVLSGTALIANNKAVIIASTSSNGKSALGYSLSKLYGYPIFSDGILLLQQDPATKIISVIPGNTPTTLWQDSCDKLELDYTNLLPVRKNLLRYELPLTTPTIPALEVVTVIHLKTHLANDPTVEECNGTDKIDTLLNLSPLVPLIEATNNTTTNFKLSVKLAIQARVLQITRPKKYSYTDFAQLVATSIISAPNTVTK